MRWLRRQSTKTQIMFVASLFMCSVIVSRWKQTDVASHRPEAFVADNDLPTPDLKNDISLAQVIELAKGPLLGDNPGLVNLLKSDYLNPPSQLPYNLKENEPEDLTYTRYKRVFPTWALIDSILMDLFTGRPPGFFVEAGALDGEYMSNTLQLERRFNWTGLLVEADRQSYDILLSKNRKAWASPACLSTEAYPKMVILSSFTRQGKTPIWRDRGAARIEKDPDFSGGGPGYKTFQNVQCFPTLTFLEALNVTKIDFFSLDVEGVELDILKAFPFDRIIVDVWAIEHVGQVKNNSLFYKQDSAKNGPAYEFEDSEFIAFMEARGYYLMDMFCNPIPDYIFVRRDSEVFRSLEVPQDRWVRRGLCFKKPRYDSNGYIFKLEIHRDKRHWPVLKYSGD